MARSDLYISLDQYKRQLPFTCQREGGTRVRGIPLSKYEPGKPLVSIITVVLNGAQNVEQALTSVLGQTYTNIEYIVIDGGSTDGTLDIIRRYDDRIAYWTSERDLGISDAFNKGIAASHGVIIGLLNSDDWYSFHHVEQGVRALMNSEADFVFGDLLFHDASGTVLYRIRGNPNYACDIQSKMPELCHPTVLARRTAYERTGLFDIQYRYAMDYEWFLRLHTRGGKGIYVQDMIGHMRLGGVSDFSHIKALREVREIAVKYGQPRWKAESLFMYRILKGVVRRRLELYVPKLVYQGLRSLVNRSYSARG